MPESFDKVPNFPESAWRRGVQDANTLLMGKRVHRRLRAQQGWFNWYANRGRLSLTPTGSELRRVSWRRAH